MLLVVERFCEIYFCGWLIGCAYLRKKYHTEIRHAASNIHPSVGFGKFKKSEMRGQC